MALDTTGSDLTIDRLERELSELKRLRAEVTATPQPPRPLPTVHRGNWLTGNRPVRMLVLGAAFCLVLGLVTRKPTLLALGLAFSAAALIGNALRNRRIDREDAEFAARLDSFDKQCAERVSFIAAKTAEIDAQIAAKARELGQFGRPPRLGQG